MLDPARLVFIDETAVSTNLARVRGRAPKGDRVIGTVPLGSWKTITFVAALRHNKMTAPMVVEGAMTGEMFLAYIEQCLAPTLLRKRPSTFLPSLAACFAVISTAAARRPGA